MIRYIILPLIFALLVATVASYLQQNEVVNSPQGWMLYGGIYGVLIATYFEEIDKP